MEMVNFIVARDLNDRQFKVLLDKIGNNCPRLLMHSNVYWLSRGKVFSHFASRLSEIWTFLEMQGVKHPELANDEGLLKFYYLADMTEYVNQLNVKRQGIGSTILSLQQAVCTCVFDNKQTLYWGYWNRSLATLWKTESLKMRAQQMTPLNSMISSDYLASHLVSFIHLKLAL